MGENIKPKAKPLARPMSLRKWPKENNWNEVVAATIFVPSWEWVVLGKFYFFLTFSTGFLFRMVSTHLQDFCQKLANPWKFETSVQLLSDVRSFLGVFLAFQTQTTSMDRTFHYSVQLRSWFSSFASNFPTSVTWIPRSPRKLSIYYRPSLL